MTANHLKPAEQSTLAPPLDVSLWLNTEHPLSLEAFLGRVVVVHAFQLLCPGCVSHGLPQAQRIADTFVQEQVVVLGLHTVFEHHAAMTPTVLRAFLHENRIRFPVAVDRASETGPTPKTMAMYRLRGTPSLVLIDPKGRLRAQWFGAPEDLSVGAAISSLLTEV